LDIKREVDKEESGSITASIVRSIAEYDVAIVDITGHNANVFLELGIRYGLKSNITILLTQDASKIPFDIKDYRLCESRVERSRSAASCKIVLWKPNLSNSIC
jgi:hypothetical protein